MVLREYHKSFTNLFCFYELDQNHAVEVVLIVVHVVGLFRVAVDHEVAVGAEAEAAAIEIATEKVSSKKGLIIELFFFIASLPFYSTKRFTEIPFKTADRE